MWPRTGHRLSLAPAEDLDPERALASGARSVADMAAAGIGRMVLPCFAGRELADLVQVSPPIEALTHDEWLVSHHDARHDPPIRAALDALAELLTAPERFT